MYRIQFLVIPYVVYWKDSDNNNDNIENTSTGTNTNPDKVYYRDDGNTISYTTSENKEDNTQIGESNIMNKDSIIIPSLESDGEKKKHYLHKVMQLMMTTIFIAALPLQHMIPNTK